jgi:hypothetical protein
MLQNKGTITKLLLLVGVCNYIRFSGYLQTEVGNLARIGDGSLSRILFTTLPMLVRLDYVAGTRYIENAVIQVISLAYWTHVKPSAATRPCKPSKQKAAIPL